MRLNNTNIAKIVNVDTCLKLQYLTERTPCTDQVKQKLKEERNNKEPGGKWGLQAIVREAA